MTKQFMLKRDGNFFKANLHSHSTHSDGLLTREEIIRLYKEQGYSIIMFSEHEIYTDTTAYDSDDFLVLPGIERSISLPDRELFHIQGIYNDRAVCEKRYQDGEHIEIPEYESMESVQKIIDELKAHGNFVMINHPYWSFNTQEHIDALSNYDFMELYNHGCEVESNIGLSEIFYDHALRKEKIYAIAGDDNHNGHRYQKGIFMNDSFGGWIVIQGDALTRSAISDALAQGSFYSSQGPELYELSLSDEGVVHVECSPCSSIVFKSYPRRGYRFKEDEGLITHCDYQLKGGEQWVRVICMDEQGRCAWSNPFFLSK